MKLGLLFTSVLAGKVTFSPIETGYFCIFVKLRLFAMGRELC